MLSACFVHCLRIVFTYPSLYIVLTFPLHTPSLMTVHKFVVIVMAQTFTHALFTRTPTFPHTHTSRQMDKHTLNGCEE